MFLTALAKVLPILLIILAGVALRRLRFFEPATVDDLKRLIVNVTLPAALFLAFARVSVELRYLVIGMSVFAACWLVLWLGRWLGPALGIGSPFFPSLITGFEAGMLGYAIYGAVYGQENLYKFGIIDLGQVLFVFFILVPGLTRMAGGPVSFGATLLGFLKTPVILAIVGGLLFNRLGLPDRFAAAPLLNSVLEMLGLVGAMTTPLVALVIGYGLELRPGALRGPVVTAGVRLAIWLLLGVPFALWVVGGRLELDAAFQAAVLTMILLPGPFVIPMFMREPSEEETAYVINTLTLGTLVTLFAYALVPILFPPAG
jgi:predicted permease